MSCNWISISVSQYVIDEILKGRLTRYIDPLIIGGNDDYYLEYQNGKPLAKSDNSAIYSCDFPYVLKNNLVFLLLCSDEQTCINYIKSISVQNSNKGVSSWEIVFEIEPLRIPFSSGRNRIVKNDPLNNYLNRRAFILVWDPLENSFSEEDYEQYYIERYCLSWYVEAWKNPRKGDVCFLLKKGNLNAGITLIGEFLSDSKKIENWNYSSAGYIIDVKCLDMIHPEGNTNLTMNTLKKEFGSIDWENVYSGMEIPEDIKIKLFELWNANL